MKIQTILPFHPSIAEQIQKGEKQGSITLIHGQEPWRLIHIIGEENLRLQSIEDPSDMRTVDHDTPKHFVCRLIEEVADIPKNLKGRETFKYNGKTFIPAGTFKTFGVPDDLHGIAPHLEYNPIEPPIMPGWDYKAFYDVCPKDIDIFWYVEKGCYICPGNNPFKFNP